MMIIIVTIKQKMFVIFIRSVKEFGLGYHNTQILRGDTLKLRRLAKVVYEYTLFTN